MKQLKGIWEFLYLLLPRNRKEFFLLIGFTALYFSFSSYIILHSSLIDSYECFNNYLGFDNSDLFYNMVVGEDRHPLLYYFYNPIVLISNILFFAFGIKAKTFFIVSICCYMIASSVLYIYRYLTEIISIHKYIVYMLVLFFAFLYTNLTLCFTFESFTLTAFLLSYTVYYYSKKIKEKKDIPFMVNFISCFLLGGVTITNFVKGAILTFFTKKGRPCQAIKEITIIGFIFCAITLLVISDKYDEPIQRGTDFFAIFSDLRGNGLFRCIIDGFWGSTSLSPEFTIKGGPGGSGYVITNKFYDQVWQYIFVGILFFAVVLSFIKNRRNTFALLILSLWSIDLIIHIILRFGINEGFLYSGHWAYTLPLMLGWLYKSLPSAYRKAFAMMMGIMLFVLIANNTVRLYEFIDLSIKLFPLEDWNGTELFLNNVDQ